MGDFECMNLEPNQLEKIKWKKNGQVVTPNGYVMGLKPKIRETLLEYCNKMGITKRFRDLTHSDESKSLLPNEDISTTFQGLNWYIQRPGEHWNSNMHWISPLDEFSHNDFLRTLSDAGFDEVIQTIGQKLNMDGVACYHLSFIAVSYCTQGYIHYDITDSDAKVYNVIIPLILANDTGPELDIQNGTSGTDDDVEVGRLQYKYNVASLMGDDCFHATAANDYRMNNEMRMAATIYIADIQEDNLYPILRDYTQNYPPPDRPDILLDMAGIHWNRYDSTIQLPKMLQKDFETHALQPYEISPITWIRTNDFVSGHAYRIGVPSKLRRHLLTYADTLGITQRFTTLLRPEHADDYEFLNLILQQQQQQQQGSSTAMEEFRGLDWCIQCAPYTISNERNNMYWISPGNSKTYNDFLQQLSIAGFDGVLTRIGEYLELEHLVVYNLSFMAVSYCARGYVQCDVSGTDGKLFNVILPLLLMENDDDISPPELEFYQDNDDTNDQITGGYNYVYDEATIIGDEAKYGAGQVDYRKQGKYQLVLLISIADINEDNVNSILMKDNDFIQMYPPQDQEGVQILLNWANEKSDPPHRI